MKRNWLTYVAIVTALVAGTIGSTALAGNHGPGSGGSFHPQTNSGVQRISNQVNLNQNLGTVRNLGGVNLGGVKQGGTQTLIKNFNTDLGYHIDPRTPGNQARINQDIAKKLNGAVLSNQVHINQDLTKNLNGAVLDNQVHVNPDIAKKLNGAVLGSQPKINVSPEVRKSLNEAILGNKKCDPGCNPGCHPCDPCKKGCYPWWWCPTWYGSCYQPCYPVVYTQPIVIPVGVPVAGVIEDKLMQVPVGATLTLQAANLGDAAGQVVLQMDKISMPAQINEWKNDSVTATLPMIGLVAPQKAEILLVKADGKIGSSVKIELIPAQPQSPASEATAATTDAVR